MEHPSITYETKFEGTYEIDGSKSPAVVCEVFGDVMHVGEVRKEFDLS